jgi:hypothetical protein
MSRFALPLVLVLVLLFAACNSGQQTETESGRRPSRPASSIPSVSSPPSRGAVADDDQATGSETNAVDAETEQAGGSGDDSHEHAVPDTVETTPSRTASPLASALASGSDTAAPSGGAIWSPAPGTTWQWQLSGDVDTGVDVAAYDIDLFDTPDSVLAELRSDGRTIICYFSAGSWEDWRPDAGAYDRSVLGSGNGWPGERWIDISRLDTIGPLIEARLDLAVERGCDAVEPDNVDGYANDSGFDLTPSDQIVFNSFVARAAHERGLSVGLKNAAELVGVLQPLYDWALVEECVRYDECASYSSFTQAGKAVFHVEYGGDLAYCDAIRGLGFSTLEKDEDVGPAHRPCPS